MNDPEDVSRQYIESRLALTQQSLLEAFDVFSPEQNDTTSVYFDALIVLYNSYLSDPVSFAFPMERMLDELDAAIALMSLSGGKDLKPPTATQEQQADADTEEAARILASF